MRNQCPKIHVFFMNGDGPESEATEDGIITYVEPRESSHKPAVDESNSMTPEDEKMVRLFFQNKWPNAGF